MSIAPNQAPGSDVDETTLSPAMGNVASGVALEQELEARFDPERLSALADRFLEHGTGMNLKERIDGHKFVVGIIPATSEFADLGRSVETTKFAEVFKRTKAQVYEEYTPYDEASVFLTVIDVEGKAPAGVLRVIQPHAEKLQKSIADLVVDDPSVDPETGDPVNPWLEEIKSLHFAEGEAYDPLTAWQRLCESAGVNLDPANCHDIATIAVADAYSSSGGVDGVSIALYHSCQRYALGNGISDLVTIQDIPPLGILQKHDVPFKFFPGIEAHPYGGPYDTIPAFCNIAESITEIGKSDESGMTRDVFTYGKFIDAEFLLFDAYLPEQYSNNAVGLSEK